MGKKKYLWNNTRLEVPIIVDESDLSKDLKLSDFGLMTDDTLFCSRYDCREILDDE